MTITVYCARCARTISSAEMEDGLVVETERGFFCAECARYVKATSGLERTDSPTAEEVAEQQTEEKEGVSEQAAADQKEMSPDDPTQLLKEMRSELQGISRAILYEKASVWNLVGGVGQIFAIALLLLAVIEWSPASTPILLAAILVQLVTLTCFLRGR